MWIPTADYDSPLQLSVDTGVRLRVVDKFEGDGFLVVWNVAADTCNRHKAKVSRQ